MFSIYEVANNSRTVEITPYIIEVFVTVSETYRPTILSKTSTFNT